MDELKRRKKPYTADAPKKIIQVAKKLAEANAIGNNSPPEKVKLRELPYTLSEMRLVPRTVEYLQRVAHELVEWSKQDYAFKMSQFYSERYITLDRWTEWQERCPELKEAVNIARSNIGNRRELKALLGEYNASIVMTTMPLHDPEYKAWRLSLRPKEEQQKNDIRVFIEPYKVEAIEIAPTKELSNDDQSAN